MAAAIAMVRKQKLTQINRENKRVERDQEKNYNNLKESIQICIKVNQINP